MTYRGIYINQSLYNFLLSVDALDSFADNFLNTVQGTHRELTINIRNAFVWHSTPQGIKYWRDLDRDYKALKGITL